MLFQKIQIQLWTLKLGRGSLVKLIKKTNLKLTLVQNKVLKIGSKQNKAVVADDKFFGIHLMQHLFFHISCSFSTFQRRTVSKTYFITNAQLTFRVDRNKQLGRTEKQNRLKHTEQFPVTVYRDEQHGILCT